LTAVALLPSVALVALGRGGQLTGRDVGSSGFRGSGNTTPGLSALQSRILKLHSPLSTIGPVMFHALARLASSGVK